MLPDNITISDNMLSDNSLLADNMLSITFFFLYSKYHTFILESIEYTYDCERMPGPRPLSSRPRTVVRPRADKA
jgi:hypothetical protein